MFIIAFYLNYLCKYVMLDYILIFKKRPRPKYIYNYSNARVIVINRKTTIIKMTFLRVLIFDIGEFDN